MNFSDLGCNRNVVDNGLFYLNSEGDFPGLVINQKVVGDVKNYQNIQYENLIFPVSLSLWVSRSYQSRGVVVRGGV